MKALSVLYAGSLAPQIFEKLPGGDCAFSMAVKAACSFQDVAKTVIICTDEHIRNFRNTLCAVEEKAETISRPSWTKKTLLEEIAARATGFDLVYIAWADCSLLDPELAKKLAWRHNRFAAHYSYADGWPYGFAPEVLTPQTAGILAAIAGDDNAPVERDAIFSIIQKDINSFDIETEISTADLRHFRLSFTADSKRNVMLLSHFLESGYKSADDAETFIEKNKMLLRTLPAFFNIQVSAVCPQSCSFCPWPKYGGASGSGKDFMPKDDFINLLDTIQEFSGDAVISFSLWGEAALHPEKIALIEAVLSRPALSLVIETSGLGWKDGELQALSRAARAAAPRVNRQPPLSWIVSLDAQAPERYKEIRGAGFAEARACAATLLELFPASAYVQALRVKGFEDDIEQFYRYWKAQAPDRKDNAHIIIQKYDDFSGALDKLQASDLSPIQRRECWHIQRDVTILLDGSVSCCREDVGALKGSSSKLLWGNVFRETLSTIWKRGEAVFAEHCAGEYKGICADCDEYYTYNF
ncbi:MAG: spiro-SPASM protein [Treponema sp.]|nr:spiro-SPASM protein [Treponema sp.]